MANLTALDKTLDLAEWKRRYAAHIMKVAEWPEVAAIQNAEAAAEELNGIWEDFENNPEGAADAEMSHWEHDGDE